MDMSELTFEGNWGGCPGSAIVDGPENVASVGVLASVWLTMRRRMCKGNLNTLDLPSCWYTSTIQGGEMATRY